MPEKDYADPGYDERWVIYCRSNLTWIFSTETLQLHLQIPYLYIEITKTLRSNQLRNEIIGLK